MAKRDLDPFRHEGSILGLGFSGAADRLVSADQAGVVRVFDVPTRACVHQERVGSGLLCVAIAPDASVVAAGSSRNVVLLSPDGSWSKKKLGAHKYDVDKLAFVSSTRLVSAGDGDLNLWDIPSGAKVARRAGILGGQCVHYFALGPDAAHLAVSTEKAPLFVLDASDLRDLHRPPIATNHIGWSREGLWAHVDFSMQGFRGSLVLLDASGQQVRRVDTTGMFAHAQAGDIVLFADVEGTLGLFDLATGSRRLLGARGSGLAEISTDGAWVAYDDEGVLSLLPVH